MATARKICYLLCSAHLPSTTMKILKALSALSLSVLLTSTALADIVNVPARRPVVTIDVPDSWKPEETEKGIGIESPDSVATVFFEIARSEKGLKTIIDDNIDWLVKEQEVRVKGSTKVEKDIAVGGIKSSLMSYDADSKEWGPAKVGFIFTPVGERVLVTTFWISVKGFAKQEPVLDKILASVKPAK
jgi:hypothetical protein